MTAAIIIKAILIIICAICKAIVDTITHHPLRMRLKGSFWKLWPHDKFIPFTKYPLDGWHLCNSIMILCFIIYGSLTGFRWYVDIPVSAVLFTVTFNLFYNKILVK